ncbi:MAG: DUF2480 family protein [Cyclobacteriaceae bacterium]|nr:DUF2480 family protein [Cyclobacteriaceae bacterium]
MEQDEIINRVASSSLVTLNLEELFPIGEVTQIDLKDILYQGLILREKDLRDFIKAHYWQQYQNKNVAVFCSEDAVIPTWAYMLLGIALEPFALKVVFGDRNTLLSQLYKEILDKTDWEKFRGAKVVIKGCSDVHVPESAYVEAALRLRPLASSILYGEPCSTVPLYKKPK